MKNMKISVMAVMVTFIGSVMPMKKQCAPVQKYVAVQPQGKIQTVRGQKVVEGNSFVPQSQLRSVIPNSLPATTLSSMKPFSQGLKKPVEPSFQKKVSGTMVPYQGYNPYAGQGQKLGVVMKSKM